MNIVPRFAIGVPAPGARPLLATDRDWLLAHYSGVHGYDDPTKDVEYARKVAAYGAAANKTYEYNYLIGLGGTTFEQGGLYRAAHCLHFNEESIGVLLMLGIGVQPTREMIDAFRELRAHLITIGALSVRSQAVPHYRFRATECPGLTVADKPGYHWNSPTGEGALGNLRYELTVPWVTPIPPVQPHPPETPQTPPPLQWQPATTPTKGTHMLVLFRMLQDGAVATADPNLDSVHNAIFCGLMDERGIIPDAEWLGPGDASVIGAKMQARLAAYTKRGVPMLSIARTDFRNVRLVGPMPFGADRMWTEDDWGDWIARTR